MGVSLKTYNHSKKPLKIIIVIFLLIPLIFFSYTVDSVLAYINTFNHHFMYEIKVSEEDFMESDPELIESAVANWTKLLYDYCFPSNLTGDGWDYYPFTGVIFSINPINVGIYNESELLAQCDIFNKSDPLNRFYTFTDTGHALAYASETIIGEALKYAVLYREGKYTEAEEVRENIYKYVKALELVSDIDKDGRMARYILPDTPIARNAFKYFKFQEEYSGAHLFYKQNYTAPNGKNYTFWLQTGTSVDIYITTFACLGIIYRFVNNETIRERVRNIVDSLLEYWVRNGWKFIDYDGKSHIMGAEAVNIRPTMDASYCMAFLLVGKTVHPEKWSSLYYKYAYERDFIRKVGKQSLIGVHDIFTWSSGYFNIELMTTIAFTLNVLEDDTALRYYYRKYLDKIYEIVRYHRNAWFDTAYAMGVADFDFSDYNKYIMPPTLNLDPEIFEYIQKDVGDCLTRLAHKRKTARNFRNPISIESYEQFPYMTPINGAPYPDLQKYDWKSKVDLNNPFVALVANLLYPDMDWTKPNGIWDRPIPADWRRITFFIWEYSPFDTISPTSYTGRELLPPGDFTLPYWIGRYLNFTSL
ncbi:MAG: hypothetical protein ACTSRZ_03195 [Promethearchaeota archaeon]